AQGAGNAFNVTVNGVDANWNLVTNATHTVGMISSATNATLPANASLVSGTKSLSITLNSIGSATVTASDISNPSYPSDTSPSITVGGGTPRRLAIQTQPS